MVEEDLRPQNQLLHPHAHKKKKHRDCHRAAAEADAGAGADAAIVVEENSDDANHRHIYEGEDEDMEERNGFGGEEDDDIDGSGEGKMNEKRKRLLEAFRQSFGEVQEVLEQNRALISQVNENHQSKIPKNLSRNVSLIREINRKIAKAVSIYSRLSTIFRHRSSSLDDNPNATS